MSFLDNLKARRAAMAAATNDNAENNHEDTKVNEPVTKKISPLEAIRRRREAAVKTAEEKKPVNDAMENEEGLQERIEAAVAKAMEEPVKAEVALNETKEVPASEQDADKNDAPVVEAETKEQEENVSAETTENNDETQAGEPVGDIEITDSAEEKKSEGEPAEGGKSEDQEKKIEEDPPKVEASKEENPKEEAPKEEKKPTKRGRKKSTGVPVQEFTNYDVLGLGKKVSYDEMAGIVMSYYLDDDWEAIQNELSDAIEKIRIEDDMNPGTLKAALADLNALNDRVFRIYVEQKQLLSMLTDKDYGVAAAIQAQNSVGTNAEERKKNGLLALANVDYDGKTVNLINLINATKMRFIFIEKLSSNIEKKCNLCITMSSAIKVEEKLCAA